MKTIIIYSTKYGFVESCINDLKKGITGDITILNVKNNVPDLSVYENVIIGSSIYMGQIRKELKNFLNNHMEILKTKRIGLFICGLKKGEQASNELNLAFPKELTDQAIFKECLGGEIQYKKLNFFEKVITKMVARVDQTFPKLDEHKNVKIVNEDSIKVLVNYIHIWEEING